MRLRGCSVPVTSREEQHIVSVVAKALALALLRHSSGSCSAASALISAQSSRACSTFIIP